MYIQITLPSYGVLAFIGGFIALLFIYFRLDRFQVAFTQLLKIFALCLIGCVLGSKILYAVTQMPWLVEHFSFENLLMLVPRSGYVFYGGLLGVILAIRMYTRKNQELRSLVYRMVTPAFPLFHGFGRIGCFMAGCCYGIPLSAPMTVFGMLTFDRLPVQIFEATFEFILFVALLVLEKKKPQVDTLKVYLLAYAVFRFTIEFFRGDAVRGFFLGLSTAQWVSLGIAAYYLLRRFRKQKATTASEVVAETVDN